MLIRYVRMTFKEDKIEDFLEVFHATKHLIRAREGCQHLELQKDIDNPTIFMTHSHWNSETDLNKHYQKLSVIRQIVDNSNLSHQEVVYVTKAIDSLQADMVAQVKAQLEQPAPTKK